MVIERHADRAWFDPSSATPDQLAACAAFGAWIRAARRALRCSQADFGALAGVHQTTISRLERGTLRHLKFATAVRLLVLILEALGRPRPAGVPPMPRMSRSW